MFFKMQFGLFKKCREGEKKYTSLIGIVAFGFFEEEKYKINEFFKC